MHWILGMLLAASGTATLAQAQPFIEVDIVDAQDIDPETAQGSFGDRVRLAGDGRTLLAAAPLRNDPAWSGSQNGSVYSFKVLAGGQLQLEQTLEPGARTQFGRILAADGDWAAIGESGDRVRIYRRVNQAWTQTQLLRIDPDVPVTPGVTVRRLDSDAAMSGNLLAIGDATSNIAIGGVTRSNAGSVILFRRGGDNLWHHESTLIAPLPDSSSGFGDRVAVSGSTVVVGAQNDTIDIDGSPQIVGGAYLYRRSGGEWLHVRTLRDPDPVPSSRRFGWSVALEDDIAVVGCATCGQPETGGVTNTGAFFTYRRDLGGTHAWGLAGKTVAGNPSYIDDFSYAMRLRNRVLLVGAPGSNAQGASFFLGAANGQWIEHSVLTSSTPANTTHFGRAVDFSGGHAIVGAPRWPDTSPSERWGAISSWYSGSIAGCRGSFDSIYCDRFEAPR